MKTNRENSILHTKSYNFAIRIVKLSIFLQTEKKEFVLNKQILRSGTAIGALVRESEFAQSIADFVNKLSIALKEANETDYWLSLLKDTSFIDEKSYNSLATDCNELIALLVSSIKTAKNNQKRMNNDEKKN
ncbi:MAG: four helix bundle protein [Prevotellaceae bacterium]|jgi:four helix bundle protein|nr:four helix bundle protein [Prevotellaceae bacterium]